MVSPSLPRPNIPPSPVYPVMLDYIIVCKEPGEENSASGKIKDTYEEGSLKNSFNIPNIMSKALLGMLWSHI